MPQINQYDSDYEYDQRQLKLMYESLVAFEQKKIDLHSLIGTLEFLLQALEEVEDKWEEKFLNEIYTLEAINAEEIINESDKISETNKEEKQMLISDSILNLKKLLENG